MSLKRLKVHFLLIVIFCIIWNSFFIDESSAFTYSNPSTTPLWSYSTGNQFVSAVEISDDGTYITATSENSVTNINEKAIGKLFLFNNSISEEKRPLWNYSIENSFSCIAISVNGSYIIAGGGSSERRVYLFNNSNPTPQWTYDTGGWVYDVETTEDGNKIFAACGSPRKVFLFNNTESPPVLGFNTTGLALRVAISSNGSYMAVTDNDAKLYFFNTSKKSPEWTFTLEGDMSSALSMSADGNYIASGGDKVYVFNKISSIPIWTYNTPDEIRSIKVSQNGNYIVAGGGFSDNKVYFFNSSNPSPEWTYSTKEDIASVAISFNGDYVVTLSHDNFLYLFNKSSSVPIWRYRLDGYPWPQYDYSLSISSDGKYIVAGGRHYIYLFDRDIINAPQLIIPGYNLLFMLSIMGITLLISLITTFLFIKKIKKTIFSSVKNQSGIKK